MNDEEAAIFEIGEAYLQELQSGSTPLRDEIVAQWPELAPRLEQRLALIEVLVGTLSP